MQKSSAPLQFVLPFAANAGAGYRHTIPVPSQTSTDPALASYNDGFPPVTMEQTGSGGIPPYGQDMNGVLYAATLALQWQQSGYMYPYNSAFATATSVNGYPAGALLLGANGLNLWLNGGDNNQTNPDTSAGAGWTPVFANAGTTTINTTGGTVTLTQNQLTSLFINVTGALTSNLTIVLPLTAGSRYLVKNSTTGAFTVTVQGSTGSGVGISSSVPQHVFTDGTNWYGAGLSGGPYLPLTGTAAAASQLATAQNFSITGAVAAAAVSFNGTGAVTLNASLGNGVVTLGNMAALQANSLIGNPTNAPATPVAITLASPLVFANGTLGLSYTPVNKAGDTMTGLLVVPQINVGSGTGPYIYESDSTNHTLSFRVGPSTAYRYFGFNYDGSFSVPNGGANISGTVSAGGFSTSGSLSAGAATLSGNLTLSGTQLLLNNASTSDRYVYIYTNGVARWRFGGTNDAESGSNAGSNWALTAFSDTGSFLSAVIVANRATGQITFGTRPVFGSATPWDSGNFNPNNYALLSGATFSGAVAFNQRPTFNGAIPWDSANVTPLDRNTGGTIGAPLTINSGTNAIPLALTSSAAADTYINLVNTSTGGRSWAVGTSGQTPPTGTSTGDFFIWDNVTGAWRQRIDSSGNFYFSGNLTSYGTSVNFNATSDARVKTNFAAAEPQCVHREWFGEYDRTDRVAHGRGVLAQDVRKHMPMYVVEDASIKVPGTDAPLLGVAHAAVALEQSIWCGREIDKILKALDIAGIKVN